MLSLLLFEEGVKAVGFSTATPGIGGWGAVGFPTAAIDIGGGGWGVEGGPGGERLKWYRILQSFSAFCFGFFHSRKASVDLNVRKEKVPSELFYIYYT